LTGISPSALSCCSGVQAVRLTARGSLQRPRTLIGGLAGHTEAQLLTLGNGGMLATIATERGVWVLQSARGDRFGTQHRLSKSNQIPQSVSAAWLGGASTIVAWTSARGPAGTANPRTIYYAFGSRRGAPRRVQSLVTVPPTHRLDELQVVRHRSGATAVWVESWYDRRGKFHSEVRAANISPHPGIRKLSAPGQPAAGISIAADAAGDQGVTWKSCRANGSCIAYAAVRGARASFSSGRTFGQLDASDDPALAIGPQGQAIVAWVRSGRPMAAVGSARNRRFGAARSLSNTAQFAAELTLAYGPRRQALAAWSQGTLNPSVVGAAYTGQ
jgi:hypothetical protein